MIKQENNKYKKGKIIFPLVIGIMILANVLVTILGTAEGTKLGKLEREIVKERETQRNLTSELVTTSSLTEVKKGIDSEGFNEPESVVYLGVDEPVAQLPLAE